MDHGGHDDDHRWTLSIEQKTDVISVVPAPKRSTREWTHKLSGRSAHRDQRSARPHRGIWSIWVIEE